MKRKWTDIRILAAILSVSINPLITNDAFLRRLTRAACYLSVGAIRFADAFSALAERVGQGSVGSLWLAVHGGCCSWL